MEFTLANAKTQSFPLPKPTLAYIMDKADANVMKKLYRTCKYFYYKKPYCIVDRIFFYTSQKLLYSSSTKFEIHEADDLNRLDNIWISQKIAVCLITADIALFEKFLRKLVRCDVTRIEVNVPLPLFEPAFLSLTKSKRLKYIGFANSFIYPNRCPVPLEDLLQHITSADTIA